MKVVKTQLSTNTPETQKTSENERSKKLRFDFYPCSETVVRHCNGTKK